MAKLVKLEKANWANLGSANLQDPKMSYSFNNTDLGLPSVHIEVKSMEEIDYRIPGIRASNNLMDYDMPMELRAVDQKSFKVDSELQERENINFLRYTDTSTTDIEADIESEKYDTKTGVPEREADENSYQPWTADPDWTADGWRDGNKTERESGWSGDPDNRVNKTYAKFMDDLVPEIEDLVNNWNVLFGGDPSKVQFNKSLYNTKLKYILQPEETHSWSELWGRIAAVWKARDVNLVIKKLTEVLQKDTKDKLLPPLVSKLKDVEVTDTVDGIADFGRTLAIQAMIKKFNRDVSRPENLGWPKATDAIGYLDGARLPNHYQQMNLQSNPKGKKAHSNEFVSNKLLSNGDTSKERKSLSNYPNVKPNSKSKVSEKKDILNSVFEYNIDTLLSQKFLELSSTEIFEEMFGKDPALTSNAFILYRMKNGENSEPEIFDFRIQSFKVPGLTRATTDVNYANAVMTVPSTDYGTRKNMVETNIILDKPMKIFGKLLETVGVGLKDGDWLNLSEGFDLDYKDIGDVYLQVIPGWYISKETNQWVGDRKNWADIEGGKYPLFVFKKFRFRTVGTEFGFNAKTDGSVASLKVNVTFQRVYQTTKGGKEYFNKLLKEKFHSIDEFL